jgi:hypothetical protein
VLIAVVAACVVAPPARAQRVLATGDSMMTVTYKELAYELERYGADVRSEHFPGSGISKPDVFDWPTMAADLTRKVTPDVTIVFLGAGDVYPLRRHGQTYQHGTAGWKAAYQARVGSMLRTFGRGGAGRVYWLTLPTPRHRELARAFRTNDRSVARAVRRYGPGAEVVDITPAVTVRRRYRRKLVVDGTRQAVRQLDGVHLAPAGARLASRVVRAALQADGILPPTPVR